jgi:hypothetical protein
MAPMTGGISDTNQNRSIFALSFFQSLLSPGIPINRIMSML